MAYEITEEKFLSAKEVTELTENLRVKDRNSLILRLLLETGARPSELLEVTMDDIDVASQTILIRGKKNSRDRRLPLTPNTSMLLLSYINHYEPDHQLFSIETSRLRQIWYDYRPQGSKKSLKSLRHTFAIQLYERTKDIRLVQMALGHRSIENTMVYASYIYSKEQLADIWKKAGIGDGEEK
jgi:integrase